MRARPWLAWAALTASVSLAFARIAAYNLANFRPVSNDEGELLAVATRLATHGILGSELYVGFFNADSHYLFTLPVQHVVDAVVFQATGPGILPARVVSVMAATGTIWLVGWLALRWWGLGAAVVATGLLVVWASNLTATPGELPLLGVARVARYDVLGLFGIWLTVALLDVRARPPWWLALAAGAGAALATLTQFFGVAALLLVGGWYALDRQWRALAWAALGAALVGLPWLTILLANADDLQAQLLVYGPRGDFGAPDVLARLLATEPGRYGLLLQAPTLGGTAVLGALLAAAWLARRAVVGGRPGDRLWLGTLLSAAAVLLLIDTTKTPLYALILVPPLCLASAAAATTVVRRGLRPGQPAWLRLALVGGTLGLLGALVVDGGRAYQRDLADARRVSAYLEVGQQIDALIPAGAGVLGPERWWWPLRAHPYRSLRGGWFQWTAAARETAQPNFGTWIRQTHARAIVVNNNVRDDARDFPEPLQQQFWDFVRDCTTLVGEVADPTYFTTGVYWIVDPPPVACRDGGGGVAG